MARRTYLERLFPKPQLFQELANKWCADQSALLLGIVWNAYDQLRGEHFERVPIDWSDERKEESLNYLLALWMDRCKSCFAPFRIVHEVPEQAARRGGKALSPHPDIGFCFHENPRAVWPLEAKVLESEHDVEAYVSEIINNFLTGRYATFSSEGAMIGYLLSGLPSDALVNIGKQAQCSLSNHRVYKARPHMVSDHRRLKLPSHESPANFLCHHMILEVRAAQSA